MKHKTNKRLRFSLIILASLILLLVGGFYIYTLDYYHADAKAQQSFAKVGDIAPGQNKMTVFRPLDSFDRTIGLIFYPGGKVEAKAYAPLLEELADRGFTSVLIEMPFNLAVFGINAADKVYTAFPEVENWFLVGHSLGGAMASSYAQKHTDKLKGLILLGAYPVKETELPTLAIYGTFDKGLDLSKIKNIQSIEIIGGNHAYFGDYGEQKGDGTAQIEREEQQKQTIEAIENFILQTSKY